MITLVLALGAAALGAAVLAQMIAPVERPRTENQLLRDERRRVKEKVRECRGVIAAREGLIEEMQGLLARMREVDPRLYAPRIERIEAGIALLEGQIEVEEELLREYRRADQLLEVEVESARVVGRLDDALVEEITARLAELDATREANREMEHLLHANEEIERLLRGA